MWGEGGKYVGGGRWEGGHVSVWKEGGECVGKLMENGIAQRKLRKLSIHLLCLLSQ